MYYYCCGITDKGIMKHNEDAFLIGGKVMTSGNINNMVSGTVYCRRFRRSFRRKLR